MTSMTAHEAKDLLARAQSYRDYSCSDGVVLVSGGRIIGMVQNLCDPNGLVAVQPSGRIFQLSDAGEGWLRVAINTEASAEEASHDD